MAGTTFRDYLLEVAPPWLLRKWGRRFLEVCGLLLDGYGDAAIDAVKARFVGSTPGDALSIAGDDRRLDRLLDETDDQYRDRLLQAFPAYRQGGSSRGLQNRLREAGALTATVMETHDWSNDDGPWAHFWVIVPQPHPFTAAELWDDAGLWDDTGTWTDVEPAALIETIRALVRKWRGAHAHCVDVTIILTGGLWDPSAPETWDDAGTWDSTTTAHVSV